MVDLRHGPCVVLSRYRDLRRLSQCQRLQRILGSLELHADIIYTLEHHQLRTLLHRSALHHIQVGNDAVKSCHNAVQGSFVLLLGIRALEL